MVYSPPPAGYSATHQPQRPPSYEQVVDPKSVTLKMPENCFSISAVVMSIAIAAITTIVAYHLLNYGLTHYDVAITSKELFCAGAAAYAGAAFGAVAIGNIYMACCGHLCAKNFEDRKNVISVQLAISALAPLAFIPALFYGLGVAMNRR